MPTARSTPPVTRSVSRVAARARRPGPRGCRRCRGRRRACERRSPDERTRGPTGGTSRGSCARGQYGRGMTVRRVMGIETEYGIFVPGDPAANPMIPPATSSTPTPRRAASGRPAPAGTTPTRRRCATPAASTWAGARPHPSQLTDVEDPTLANVVLTNGARLYVDHAHPEYSSPEVTNPRDAVTLGPRRRARSCARRSRRLSTGAAGGEPLQEQHRRQGRVLRHPRELPHGAARPRSRTSCAT